MDAFAEELKELRKVELHCHLDGLLDPSLVRELDARGRPHPFEIDKLSRAWPARTFETWQEDYGALISPHFHGNAALLLDTLEIHLDRLVAQNVVYTEIMLASFIRQCAELDDQGELFKQFRSLGDRFEASGLQVEYLVTLGRGNGPEKFDAKAERAIYAFENGYACGVALAGDESAATVKSFADWFDRFHSAGMRVEIHAGEWGGPDSVWDALEYGRPHRLGHGIAVFDDPVLEEHVRATGLHIEMCPTSNVSWAGVTDLAAHPIGRAVENGFSVSVSTDDPGPLGISLESELGAARDTFGWDMATVRRLQSDALRARFAPDLRIQGLSSNGVENGRVLGDAANKRLLLSR